MSIFSISYGYEISLLEGNVMKNSVELLIDLCIKYPKLREDEPLLKDLIKAIRQEEQQKCSDRLEMRP